MTYTNRQIEQTEVMIPTPDGQMPAFLFTHPEGGQKPAVLLLIIAVLRMGGHISIMGMLNGLEIGLDALVFLTKQVTIRGMEVGSKSDFEAMNQAILTNDIHPVLDAKFTLDQIQAAFEYLEKGQHFGKVVITL